VPIRRVFTLSDVDIFYIYPLDLSLIDIPKLDSPYLQLQQYLFMGNANRYPRGIG